MEKRTEKWYRYPAVMTPEAGGGTRLRMLTITAGRVGDEEGRRRMMIGRKTAELNRNQTPDQGQDQASNLILTDLSLVLLPNTHHLQEVSMTMRFGYPH